MWLDGLYMAEPFYIKYAKIFNEPEDFRDITKQFMLMAKHGRDQKTGLFYHGWDFSKKQKWADKKTGTSPTLWGRAMGWYLMGLVDVLEYLPRSNPDRPKLISILKDFCKSLIKFQDKRSCLWYQVVDKPGKDGNYLESSASSMFMYVFAKGANNGYLDKKYLTDAYDIFENLKNKMIVKGADGRPSLINTCAGAGLGGEPYRDGSYSYYISVPKSTDDFKGLGPFIMGCLELEKASDLNADTSSQSERGKVVGLDYFFNNEWIKDKNGNETRYHYIWEDTANTGYSKLGIIIKNLNAELKEITVAPVRNNLDELSIYIIVDPDTPQETPHPNYIDDVSITNIVNWVKKGGVLVLFGNDKGNCEFEHLNKLAGNFGIHFNEDSRNRVTGTNFDIGKFDNLPVHPVFKDVKQIFLKEISTLRIHKPAKFILKDNGDVIMASAELGKGFVFAVGDPWFYNEYIDNRKLPVDFENYKAAKNLFYWLLGKAKQVD
jgi:unsaturated rhamnogalacturonyl hydrolase